MKNVSCVNEVQKCYKCNLSGFFCYTPHGADYYTCPCCGEYDFVNGHSRHNSLVTKVEIDILEIDNDYGDVRVDYFYCNKCHIMFKLGCTHNRIGCTDDIFNGHFIKKWKHKVTNIVHEGMPMFDDERDWYDNANNVEVLQMYCPHKNNKCNNNRIDFIEICSL